MMSGRKGCTAAFVDMAAILAEQARQRIREAEERARLAREAARQRREQARRNGQQRCSAVETRGRTLLVVPLSQFADANAVHQALSAIDRIRTELSVEGLTESKTLELLSRLEVQECVLNEHIALASGFVQQQRKHEQRLFELERELVTNVNPLAGRFQCEAVAGDLRKQAAELRRRLEKAGPTEIAIVDSEIGSFRCHQVAEIQRLSAIAEAAGRQETRMREIRKRAESAAKEYAAHWDAIESDRCLSGLTEIQGQLSSAATLSDVQRCGGRLTETENRFGEVLAGARGRRRAEHLAAEEQNLVALTENLDSLDGKMVAKFGDAERVTLNRRLENIRALLKSGNLEQVSRDFESAKPLVRDFVSRIQRATIDWEAARGRAEERYQEVLRQWSSVSEDAELLQRLPGRGEPTKSELARIKQEISAENFDRAAQMASVLLGTYTVELATARRLVELERAFGVVDCELKTLHEVTASRFDAVGRSNVESYLNAGRKAITTSQFETAVKLLGEAQRTLAAHRETALRQFEKYRQERDAASEKLSRARDIVQALLQDEVVCRWKQKDLNSLTEKLNRAEAAIGDGRCSEAEKIGESVEKTAAEIPESVKPLESQFDLQRRMAKSIEAALGDLGFDCDVGAEDPADPKSAIILQAERPVFGLDTPGRINVAVERTGALEYNVGGAFEKNTEYDARFRRPVSRCDEAEEKLLELHSVLRGMGIKTSTITWDGKRPDNDEGLPLPVFNPWDLPGDNSNTRERGHDET